MLSIYVLPTEEGRPPQAIVGVKLDEDHMAGLLTIWNADSGHWVMGGEPVSPDLGDAITQHAKDLGVKW